ncbi:MAG: sulfotransferase [Pseudomonadota bacterium]
MQKVGVFIAGVQKGGTTALHAKLVSTPGLSGAARKELHFFDREDVNWYNPPYGDLTAEFAPSTPEDDLLCDATPIYLFWPNAIERVRRYNPDARIIVMLRHPVFRAISAWKMERARNREPLPLALSLSALGEVRCQFGYFGGKRIHSYLARGFYAAQIDGLLEHFRRDQVLFLKTEDLWDDEEATIARVRSFLGLPPCEWTSAARPKYIAPVHQKQGNAPRRSLLKRLSRLYRADLVRTSELTGLDLLAWTNEDFREPMTADR